MIPYQIKPNHADHITNYNSKFLDRLAKDAMFYVQLKYDGERMLIHFVDGKVYCTSRRISKKTEKFMENQDKFPQLQKFAKQLKDYGIGYTVLDCECYGKDWSTSAGIIHSLPDRAIELQKDPENWIKFAVFDCLYYDDVNLMDMQYSFRLNTAYEVVKSFDNDMIHLAQGINSHGDTGNFMSITYDKELINLLMNRAIDKGFEGIVLKRDDLAYYAKAASLKCKKFETVDVVVIDYERGRGKYADTIGALKVGYYDDGKFVRIANVNCSTDEERNRWRDEWASRQYSVIEVKCQEITDRSLRHPRYVRIREDKDYTMCTRDTIFKE